MIRRLHLQHTANRGPTCQTGRAGGSLRGEHITVKFDEFSAASSDYQCSRCAASKLFAFLNRQAADQWIPEAPDAWKIADDKLLAARR